MGYRSIHDEERERQGIKGDPPRDRKLQVTNVRVTWGMAFDVGFKLWVVFSVFNAATALVIYVLFFR